MERRLIDIDQENSNDLIWILQHEDIYTGGTSFNENEIIDKTINVLVTNLSDDRTKFFGRSEYMTPVLFEGEKENIGKIIPVKIPHSYRSS